MKLEFLGTGAADWVQPEPEGEYRRLTSTLIDGALLVDLTMGALERLAHPEEVTDLLITHSHSDHFDPAAVAALAPKRVHVHEGWADRVSVPGVAVVPVREEAPFEAAGHRIVALRGNHSTEDRGEHTLHYLIEAGGKRLYYATDGAWLLYREAKLLRENPLDALVIDATIGDDREGDYRVFEHNSLPMVRILEASMRKNGMLKADAPVFLTHLARTLHPNQAALEAANAAPFVVCRDGLTAEI